MRQTGLFTLLFLLISIMAMPTNGTAPVSEDPEILQFLDQALSNAHTDRAQRSISEPWESGFLVGARMPVLVDTLVNPFYLPIFTQVFGARFSGNRSSVSPMSLLENAFEMLNLDTSGHFSKDTGNMSPVDALENLQASHHRGVIESDYRLKLSLAIETWPKELQEATTIIIQAFTYASLERKAAVEGFTREELERVTQEICDWSVQQDVTTGNAFLSGVDDNWPTDLQLLRKIDYSRLFNAARILTEAIEVSRTRLQVAMEQLPVTNHDEILLEFHSAAGTILIGGRGINRYENDAALLIDLGGNDVYRNNAGGFIDAFDGVCCLIDMDGNDSYENSSPGKLAGAITTVGILVDYDGHDSYRSHALSQGTAFCGVGMLYDESGNDIWSATQFAQGAAAFGIGLAIDVGGDDSMICRSTGQGFATTLGAGILVNVNGNDSYSAGPAWIDKGHHDLDVSVFCQGAAAGFHSMSRAGYASLYGGIGFLVDGHGDDQYAAGNFSQGASRFASMGLLLDSNGNDLYQAKNNSQGMAMDWSSACLIDHHGNDQYRSIDSAQGTAIHCSTGYLLDYSGDDTYQLLGTHGQAHSRERASLGIMIDYRGYDDISGGPYSRGYSICPLTEPVTAAAIFLNHRGKDTYDVQPGSVSGNNQEWVLSYGGFGADTPLAPDMFFANERALSRHQHYDMSPVSGLENGVEKSQLGSVDPYTTFHALGSVIDRGPDVLPVIVKAMQRGHDSYRRTMEEALGQIILADRNLEYWDDSLKPLFQNLDPSTRQWALQQLIHEKKSQHLENVRQLLSDSNAKVRNTAVKSMVTFRDESSEQYLKHIALNDPEPTNRLNALETLGLLFGDKHPDVFRDALTDTNLAVHLEALRWIQEFKDLEAIGLLQLLTSNHRAELRLSSAKALVSLGEKSGFPILIDMLNPQHTVKSPHDHSESLLGFLKQHSGRQLEYNTESWRQWWIKAEASFDLDLSHRALEDYQVFLETIKTANPKQTSRKLDKLRKKYPGYKGLDNLLAHWVRVKSSSALEAKSIKTALKLAEYSVEMMPTDAANWAALSESKFALDQPVAAFTAIIEALELDSANKHYRKLRDIYLKAMPEDAQMSQDEERNYQ